MGRLRTGVNPCVSYGDRPGLVDVSCVIDRCNRADFCGKGRCATPNLLFSTISIATSFSASALTMLRSPYYAIAYAANDVVLIVLWVLATLSDASFLPMVLCFVIFLVNDLYGFRNWRAMHRRQQTID